MKRKPTSYGDMLKSVATVQHPDLKPHHRVLLNAIAVWCGETGEHSRPTNEFFQQALGVGKSRVDEVLAEVIALGLVKCTHRGRGANNASVYRICLEHPAFQDAYKCFKMPPKVNAHHVEGDSSEVTPTEPPVNAHSQESYRPPETELTPTTWWAPSYALSKPTTTPPPKASREVVVVGIENQATIDDIVERTPGELIDMYSEQEGVICQGFGKEKPQLIALIKKHGAERVKRAWKACLHERPWTAFPGNPHYPLRFLVDQWSVFDGWADRKAKQPALTQEIIDRTNAKARADHVAVWGDLPKDDPGADDLFPEPPERPSHPMEAVEEEVSKL